MKKYNRDTVGQAIGTVADYLRRTLDNPAVDDPLDDRNAALRELVIGYLEYHFRRHFFPQELTHIPSLDSTGVIQSLEKAYSAHQRFMDLGADDSQEESE